MKKILRPLLASVRAIFLASCQEYDIRQHDLSQTKNKVRRVAAQASKVFVIQMETCQA